MALGRPSPYHLEARRSLGVGAAGQQARAGRPWSGWCGVAAALCCCTALSRSPARRAGLVRPSMRTDGARPVKVTRAGPIPGGAARALVYVQIAGQIASQIALTDPPRRLSLWDVAADGRRAVCATSEGDVRPRHRGKGRNLTRSQHLAQRDRWVWLGGRWGWQS
jgi:hypothetical protein